MELSSSSEQEKTLCISLKTYVKKKHLYDLEAILLSEDCSQHYAVVVHAMLLFEHSIDFAHSLFRRPEFALKTLDHALKKTALDMLQEHQCSGEMTMKENIHARLTALPSCPEIFRTVLPKCPDVGQFLCICGTVVRVTLPKMLEYRKEWVCTKCKYQFQLDVEAEQDFAVVKPSVCANPDQCYSKNFVLSSKGVNAAWCKDFQEVKVQEQVHNLVVGSVPQSMWVILENDLVDSCQAGNDVVISGVLHTRWQPQFQGARSDIELIFIAHSIEVKNSIIYGAISEDSLKEFQEFWQLHENNALRGRDFILSCFCPQVFGLYIVKLAVALVLAGGVQRVDSNSSTIRGDSHLLLVGDPGTGKSQFLKYASKVSKRSVLTSGVGTTNAGLTVAAVKDGGKWQLEAGALVLADGGICCIDEFSSIKEQDKASIHEAMEQQTISVAKAGLVCKLNTQCSILAATNPKGKYNKNESLSANTAMASPLLSRFDIIIVLLDTYSEKWDQLVSSYILEGKDMRSEKEKDAAWSMEKMRTYFSAIRNIRPKLTPDSDRILQAYYKKQRSMVDRSAARTTPRLLQSLVRLAQGHARLMFRLEVLAMDAIAAITVMESSMNGFGLFHNENALHTTFPDDPQEQYMAQATIILKTLDLENLLKQESSAKSPTTQSCAVSEILTQMDPYLYQNEVDFGNSGTSQTQAGKFSGYSKNRDETSGVCSEEKIRKINLRTSTPSSDTANETVHCENLNTVRELECTERNDKTSQQSNSSEGSAPLLHASKYFSENSNHLAENGFEDIRNEHKNHTTIENGINTRNHGSYTSENSVQPKRKRKDLAINMLDRDFQSGILEETDLSNEVPRTANTSVQKSNLHNSKSVVRDFYSLMQNLSQKRVVKLANTNAKNASCTLRKRINVKERYSSSEKTKINERRNANKSFALHPKQNRPCLSNNVSSISELNALFSTEFLEAEVCSSSSGPSKRILNKLENFAYVPGCKGTSASPTGGPAVVTTLNETALPYPHQNENAEEASVNELTNDECLEFDISDLNDSFSPSQF